MLYGIIYIMHKYGPGSPAAAPPRGDPERPRDSFDGTAARAGEEEDAAGEPAPPSLQLVLPAQHFFRGPFGGRL